MGGLRLLFLFILIGCFSGTVFSTGVFDVRTRIIESNEIAITWKSDTNHSVFYIYRFSDVPFRKKSQYEEAELVMLGHFYAVDETEDGIYLYSGVTDWLPGEGNFFFTVIPYPADWMHPGYLPSNFFNTNAAVYEYPYRFSMVFNEDGELVLQTNEYEPPIGKTEEVKATDSVVEDEYSDMVIVSALPNRLIQTNQLVLTNYYTNIIERTNAVVLTNQAFQTNIRRLIQTNTVLIEQEISETNIVTATNQVTVRKETVKTNTVFTTNYFVIPDSDQTQENFSDERTDSGDPYRVYRERNQ